MAISLENRTRILAAVAKLPPQVFLTSSEAAAYLGTSPGVLANWRAERSGPKYSGHGPRFVRYRVSDLDQWMQVRAGEVGAKRHAPATQPQAVMA